MVILVDGLPVLTLEAMLADLVEQWTDMSLVVDMLRDLGEQARVLDEARLEELLAPPDEARLEELLAPLA